MSAWRKRKLRVTIEYDSVSGVASDGEIVDEICDALTSVKRVTGALNSGAARVIAVTIEPSIQPGSVLR